MRLILTALLLFYSGIAFAGTAIVEWDPYVGSANFKELRLYRGWGSACGTGATPLSTPAGTIPKSTPMPTTFTDTAAPDIIGMLCYELSAVDVIPGTTPTTLESKRSNRALKMLESTVQAPTTLKVKP